MNLVSVSENTVLLLYEQKVSKDIFADVKLHLDAIESDLSEYIIDIVPSYATIQIVFNLRKITSVEFRTKILSVTSNLTHKSAQSAQRPIVEIPVYYGSEVAPDIHLLAEHANMSIEEVISRHSAVTYEVFATGFAPGYAYLGILDENIAMPRKSTPRLKVPAGSLALADRQTAIYPSTSPGGWQIIGRTPVTMIDYNSEQLTRFTTGDRIKFEPINKDEYLKLGGLLE